MRTSPEPAGVASLSVSPNRLVSTTTTEICLRLSEARHTGLNPADLYSGPGRTCSRTYATERLARLVEAGQVTARGGRYYPTEGATIASMTSAIA